MSEQETGTAVAEAGPKPDDIGLDRELVLQLAQVPFVAAGLVLLNWLAHLAWPHVTNMTPNLAPVAVVLAGMVLAAVIDGWAFKVPNWLTLSLVLSGWVVAALHDFGVAIDDGVGGIGAALAGTALGFALLFPMLAIGGMGEGDVKMQMGFGAWVGAHFGLSTGLGIVLKAFCLGALVGGVFGVVIIVLRGRYRRSAEHFGEIGRDLKTAVEDGIDQANARARTRRKEWIRLPYGVPLCVGFIGYLAYHLSMN